MGGTKIMWIKFILFLQKLSLLSWLDRARGNPENRLPKAIALFLMGYICALYAGHGLDWRAPLFMVAVWAGHGIGYGQPLGYALTGVSSPEYENWQITKLLKVNPWLALALRGIFVGIAALITFDYIAAIQVAVAFGAAFPLASYFVRFKLKMPTTDAAESAIAWAKQEEIRGLFIELFLIIGLIVHYGLR
jgi:hypothetical protein